MHDSIVNLANTTQLFYNLHLSTFSVLLFTAAWSVESQHARDALLKALPLTPCQSSIRMYELAWPPSPPMVEDGTNLRRTPKSLTNSLPGALKQLNAMFNKPDVPLIDTEVAHRNITTTVNWLPCIQLYSNNSQYIKPLIYRDSFDEHSIASFLSENCHITGALTLNEDQNTSAYMNLIPVSRDDFSQALYVGEQTNEPQLYGLLIVLRDGRKALYTQYLHVWKAIASFIQQSSSSEDGIAKDPVNDKSWVVSVVDSVIDSNFIQTMRTELSISNISPKQSEVSLMAIDPVKDVIKVISCDERCSEPSWLAQSLGKFTIHEKKKPMHDTQSLSGQHRLLAYIPEPYLLDQHIKSDQCPVSLHEWMGFNFSEQQQNPIMVWLVVYQTWCAFCQRVLSVYERFSEILEKSNSHEIDAYVVFNEDPDQLPEWLDKRVDGFPTILLLRQWGHWSSVEEYDASHDIELLKSFHDHHSSFQQNAPNVQK